MPINKCLIISIDGDSSTSDVIDWINRLGGTFIRINNNRFTDDLFTLEVENRHKLKSIFKNYIFNEELASIWYRRSKIPDLPKLDVKDSVVKTMSFHLTTELFVLLKSFYHLIPCETRINSPENSRLNKLNILIIADKIGLNIPPTLITNEKRKVINFLNKHKRIIAKNINDIEIFEFNNKHYATYTSILDQNIIDSYPENFFPSLFQKYIDKDFEIRSFYFFGKFYSMAIFSQNDPKTSVDFRRYNRKNPNRTTPFKLPKLIESKLNNLMKEVNLNSGSIDLIRAKNGKYYFLEINPVGQFGMVSNPCNYNLEKIIAKRMLNIN